MFFLENNYLDSKTYFEIIEIISGYINFNYLKKK